MAIQYTPTLGLPYPEVTDAPLIASRDLRALAQKMDSEGAQIRGESMSALTAAQAAEALAAQAMARAEKVEFPIAHGTTPPEDEDKLWVAEGEKAPPTKVAAADITDATDVGRNVLTAPLAVDARNALDIWTGTRALLDAGTDTAERTWDAKELHEYVTDAVAAGGGAASWDDLTGKPETFPPSAHTHDDRYRRAARGTLPSGADTTTYRGQANEGLWIINASTYHTLTGLPQGYQGVGIFDVAWAHNFAQTQTVTEADTGRQWMRTVPPSARPREWVRLDNLPTRSSTTTIAAIGDSLTHGYSSGQMWSPADAYPAHLAAWLGEGFTVNNLGKSGAESGIINARLGILPLAVTIPGGTIPTTGTVPVECETVVDYLDPEGFSLEGTLGGVASGTLSYTAADGWLFTRPGSGGEYPFTQATFVGQDVGHENDTIIYMAGRNDITRLATGMEATVVDHVMRANADVMAWAAPTKKQVVLCGSTTRTNEEPGTARFEMVQELSARLRLAYPANFLDVQGYLTGPDVWGHAGITPTAADLEAQARGVMPQGLFDDTTHWSRPVAQAVAEHLIGPFLKRKGWVW